MKKSFVILLSLLMFVFPSFAEETFEEVNNLIESGLSKNEEEISSLADDLNIMEKHQLYDMHEKNGAAAFSLGNMAGFGVGSFAQGDIAGGVTILTGQVLGIAGMGLGSIAFIVPILTIVGAMAVPNNYFYITGGIMIGGCVSYVGMVIYGFIRPFTYANHYNKMLKESLKLGDVEELSFAPIVNPYDREYGLQVSVRL